MENHATVEKQPDIQQLEEELHRERYRKRYRKVMGSTVCALVVVAAFAILTAMLWTPVLRIYGTSMTPTLNEGEVVVAVKDSRFDHGDVVGVYYGSKLLVKRCIATAGEWVDIDEEGNVYVNDELLDEPYLEEKALGECDIKLPYQVPDHAIFVVGDHRETSVDSRNKKVGCIDEENVVGRIVLRIWPLRRFGFVK